MMTLPNTSFSKKLPLLQLALDSTSINLFLECPRKYQLSIIYGYRPHTESVHLTFGLLLHRAHEIYWHLQMRDTDWQLNVRERQYTAPLPHEDALEAVVDWVLCATWDFDLNRPWQSDHKTKNRFTLLRTIIWYLDAHADDPLQVIRLASGRPAVELSFTFDTKYSSTTTNEPFIICGHMDKLVAHQFQNIIYTSDLKTTLYALNDKFFAQFTPHTQFTIYTIAGRTVFGVPTAGVVADGIQVTLTGPGTNGAPPFRRNSISRTQWQLDEWHKDLSYTLEQLEKYATDGHYPKREASCGNYGGCQFRSVCSAKSPDAAQQLLNLNFSRRTWDPLQRRGDI